MKFPIVYCDPPWEYNSRAAWADTRFGGGAADHYNVSDDHDMAAWAVQFLDMRPDSGVMLMWVTGPFMEAAPVLMRSWGYTPIKPIFYWVKTTPNGALYYGPGAYTGSNVEFILLGQANMKSIMGATNRRNKGGDGRGVFEVHRAPEEMPDEAHEIAHPRQEQGKIVHSKKPDLFRRLAVQLFGDVPRVEVFAREQFAGWHAIGDQLPGGSRLEAGKVITPLPPPPGDIAHRRHGNVEQRGLWGAQTGEPA